MDTRKNSRQRGYSYRWEKARLGHLRNHPLCVYCMAKGIVKAASVVDHVRPHKGDSALFWDPNNRQSLCATCHNSTKKREELAAERIGGCDADGFPRDPSHHWRTG